MEAIQTPDKVKWIVAVEEDHRKINKYNIWKTTELKDMPPETRIIKYTCSIKKEGQWEISRKIEC